MPAPFVVGRALPKAFHLSITVLSVALFLFGIGMAAWQFVFEARYDVLVLLGFGMFGRT